MKALRDSPELANYHDEPRQLPSGAPGKNGHVRLGFERRGARTALIDLERRAPLLAQQALYYDEAMPELPCVMIISTAGGILQGDRNTIEIDLAADCRAHVTTQSSTKVQEMDANYASQVQEIVLGEGAYLEYLPDPIIPYRHTRFITRTRIVQAPSATLLYAEVLMPGRTHYGTGERFAYDLFSSTIRAERPNGNALCVEKFIIEPARCDVRERGIMGNYDIYANVLLLTPSQHAARIFAQVAAAIDADAGWAAGASRLPREAGLVYKVVGMDRETVQAKVRAFWTLVRREVTGADVPQPYLWR
jgi:urease accessory protein